MIEIEPLTADYAAEVAAFYRDIRMDTVPVIHTVVELTEWLQMHRISRGSSYVARSDGRIVGWVDVIPGDLDQLYCRRGETGKGIGKALLDFAKSKSPDGLELFTFQVNEGARRFYSREGFAEVYWGDGTGNEEGKPDVKMKWPGR
jgi:GNAT superfamily N-acetyltransferase